MGITRRQRQRTATISEIKLAAWAQIAEVGAPAMSLRGVARAIGMSPAGLYRYFDGLDELVTALLVDAYDDLADAVETAIDRHGDAHVAAFTAGVHAYRDWASTHPNRFLLIFGTPIPGYAAPEDGPTVAANARMGQAFLLLAARAHRDGVLPGVEDPSTTTEREVELCAQLATISPDFPIGLVGRMLGLWARWHGLVLLEITNQLHWIYADAGAFFDAEVQRMLADVNLSDPAAATSARTA